jgi:CMP-N,N'-diacetyllegionaminic acid synthase
MIDGQSVLAIIPARGGSKGLPRKNILPLLNKPMIAWTIEAAKRSMYIDRIIVSTDDDEIADISKKYGAEIPFKRPRMLAQDDTPSIDVVLDIINKMPNYDYILLLQPTSPLRSTEDIDKCIKICLDKNAPACVSVIGVEKSPYWMYKMSKDQKLEPILEGKKYLRRQDTPSIFILNGAVYFARTEWVLISKQFVTRDTIAIKMPKSRSIDIDDEFDYEYLKYLLYNNIKTNPQKRN